ncbi:CDP-alcohol phosphatidyltransferase family protein [Actinoallomurus acanthiterrae]
MVVRDMVEVVDRIETERPGPVRVARRATGRWRFPPGPLVGAMAQPVLFAVLTVTTGLGLVGWLAGVAYAATLGSVLGRALRRRGRRSLAPADHVTLVRALLVGCVTALVADTVRTPAPIAPLVAISAVALALDAVDGRVARRTGTASPLGARFDMEIDAFLILVLSVFVATSLGAWVLAIGAMRYAFVAAGLPLRWLLAPLSPLRSRSVVAALQGIVLTVVAAGVLPRPVEMTVTALALAALVWSFTADILRLHRKRRAA